VTDADKRMEQLQVSLKIAYESWANETPFGILTDEKCEQAVAPDHLQLFRKKAAAVLHKREMVWIAGAELNALCDHVVGMNRAGDRKGVGSEWHFHAVMSTAAQPTNADASRGAFSTASLTPLPFPL
jgi:hypothetical protein